MKFIHTFIAGASIALLAATVQAAVTAEEAQQLGSTLTPFGAQK
jgi:hypothetical protein